LPKKANEAYRLSEAEVAALLPPADLHIADWIEQNRVLNVASSAEPGPKSMARTPFLRMILDAWMDDHVREIVVQKSAQIGMTDLAVDLTVHTAADAPAPMAVFLADQATAEKVSTERIQVALRDCKALAGMIDESRMTRQEASLRNGFNLLVGWASSIALTASRPIKLIIADEVNKPGYQAIGAEGSTIGRLRERQETFADSKLLLLSTPTIETGEITKELATCEVVYDWAVPCPSCGAFQVLRFFPVVIDGKESGSVAWEGGREATREQIEATARYKCGHCVALWTSQQKNDAVLRGMAMPRSEPPPRARKVGFHLNRLISLFPGGRLDALVSSWLRSRTDIGEMQNFYNSTLGEAWVQRVSAGQDEAQQAIMECKTTLPKATVPDEAVALTCGIDVQQKGFWYRVRAWGEDTTSWGIDEGFLSTWEDVETLLFSSYAQHSGQRLPIWRALIDTGGGKEDGAYISRTEETYNFIRQHQGKGVGLFGSKGSSRTLPTKIKIGNPIEKTPSGKPIPGGIRIVMMNTQLIKDAIEARISQTRTDGGSGSWYVHADTPEWYAKQMTAEEKRADRKTKIVEWVQIRRDNHMLDCEVMCYVMADPEFHGGLRPLITLNRRASRLAAPAAQVPTTSKEPANPAIRRY
jgi:phage terminase large subunit GpA-like protein